VNGSDKAIRVLHLPTNMASVMSENVRALTAVGVEARGFVFGETSPLVNYAGLTVIRQVGPPASRLLWLLRQFMWADLVHWYWHSPVLPKGRDLGLLRRLRKPVIVEWMGSDVRNPEVELADNPWFRRTWRDVPEFRGMTGSCVRSHAAQERFARIGATSLVHPGEVQYLNPELRSRYFKIMIGLDMSALPSKASRPGSNARPLVVHSPSNRLVKGTGHILEVVEALRNEGLDFDFTTIEGLDRSAALKTLAHADILIDQMILGNYGVASIEAMAMGVPVICYLKPSVLAEYPADLPIVNADPATLGGVLRNLVMDESRRITLGRSSQRYALEHHDVGNRTKVLLDAYQSVLQEHNRAPVNSHGC
jgi:hypothetical protein